MIFDRLANAPLYHALHPGLAAALSYVSSIDPATADGVYPLEGEDLVARVQSYDTRSEEEQSWESHRTYLDVQVVLSGEEHILWSQVDQLTGGTSYDSTKDLIKYSAGGREALRLTLRPGDFAVFFPHDGHKPGVSVAGAAAVRKVVMKVAMW